MSIPVAPDPAKLTIGILTREKGRLCTLASDLVRQFGPIDTVSRWLPFDHTRYYAREMGAPLYRRVMTFGPLIAQEALAGIKLSTNALEAEYAQKAFRTVNIDPGYLLRERFVLATGKNFAHRIHIGKGIYADLTLIYRDGAFSALPWTYADYARPRMLSYLSQVRKKYVLDLENLAA